MHVEAQDAWHPLGSGVRHGLRRADAYFGTARSTRGFPHRELISTRRLDTAQPNSRTHHLSSKHTSTLRTKVTWLNAKGGLQHPSRRRVGSAERKQLRRTTAPQLDVNGVDLMNSKVVHVNGDNSFHLAHTHNNQLEVVVTQRIMMAKYGNGFDIVICRRCIIHVQRGIAAKMPR